MTSITSRFSMINEAPSYTSQSLLDGMIILLTVNK